MTERSMTERSMTERSMTATKERVLVAMSGGVDSSVAAAMLVEQGYDVVGATMKLFCHDEDLPDRPCCSLDSVNDARRVCQQLGVPHYVLNLESAFGRDVVEDFVNEYANGRTPIPCVRCNTFTKFRDLLVKADAIDAKWIATGHYARTVDGVMYRGVDHSKDQSYFLWGIDRRVLSRMILPVGSQTKAATRAVAHQLGLEVIAEKVESQDICFVPDGDHTKIIRQRLGADAPSLSPGSFELSNGLVVGTHDGFARFTIGQRRGLPGGFREPMFVVAIRPSDRAVVIGPREELLGRGVVAREINWLVDAPSVGTHVDIQVRHRARPARAEIVRLDGCEIELALDEPVSAITPGQSLVLYDGERVLGGGFIERAAGRRAPLPVRAA
jgi:tRNA-uridine 2-sulfurtransferase